MRWELSSSRILWGTRPNNPPESEEKGGKDQSRNHGNSKEIYNWVIYKCWHSQKLTFSVFMCGKLNRSSKEEMQIKYKWHFVLTNHAVGCTAAPSTSHTAWSGRLITGIVTLPYPSSLSYILYKIKAGGNLVHSPTLCKNSLALEGKL